MQTLTKIDFAFFLLTTMAFGAAQQFPFPAANMTVVKPQESEEVLLNPGIGFTTFQRFNGDALNKNSEWTEGLPIVYQHSSKQTADPAYPASSIAYFRLYWRFLQPERDVYRWDLIDKALEAAHQHGQTLMLRIAPHGGDESSDVPPWYRTLAVEPWVKDRPPADWSSTRAKWLVNPENPAYAHEFGGLIRKLGERYDGNPNLEAVDFSILGAWGEGAGSELLTEPTRQRLVASYIQGFHKTPVLLQLSDPKTVGDALAAARDPSSERMRADPPLGWRADCLGDMGGFSPKVNTMTDLYPQAVENYGLQHAWEKARVSMEACWVMQHWKDKGWDLQYIMDQSIKWHMSSFNAKSSAVPLEWRTQVAWWLNHMGYRFVLRRFSFSTNVDASRELAYQSWWENKGDAPVYRKYVVALRLSQHGHAETVLALAGDPRQWLPGDSMLDGTIRLPATLPDGEYDLAIALADSSDLTPKIKLAVKGTAADGWYPLGVTRLQTIAPSPISDNLKPPASTLASAMFHRHILY